MHDLRIEYIAPAKLTPNPNNPRTHSKKQLKQLTASFEKFGFTNPILIDGENKVLAGHGRLEAAKLAGLVSVPCVRLDHMTPAEARAYIIADNKLALNSGWDQELLAEELKFILAEDSSFDLELTGFSFSEVDQLIIESEPKDSGDPADDALPELSDTSPRCKVGDLWTLGGHRLICGNSLDPLTVHRLMNGEKARLGFNDFPYNVAIGGNVGGLGAIQHREFAMASGEMSSAQFTRFLTIAMENISASSLDGSIHFVCMDWRHMQEVLQAGNAVFSELKNLLVWVKDNGGMGTFYRSRHELVFAFKKGTAPHINNFELGQHGRYRTNVWEYRGSNTFGAGRMEELALHPTVKPVAMIADAIRDCSKRGETVLDAFGGLGSTLIAAENTGRCARLIEYDALYCDTIVRRWETYTGKRATLVVTSETFEDLRDVRLGIDLGSEAA